MLQPLALVLYERLLPGTQIVNRLQDLSYRVETIADAAKLVECAEQTKPILVVADLHSSRNNVCAEIARLKQNPATQHVPVIAFGADGTPDVEQAARGAGIKFILSEAAVLNHLSQFLDQALQVD